MSWAVTETPTKIIQDQYPVDPFETQQSLETSYPESAYFSQPQKSYLKGKQYNGYGNYIIYDSDKQRENLNLNTIPRNKVVEFPRNIYVGEPVPFQYKDGDPRDLQQHYVYLKERATHPDNFARFGYPEFDVRGRPGYGVGNQSRGYITPSQCLPLAEADPIGVAPKRFYVDKRSRNSDRQALNYAMNDVRSKAHEDGVVQRNNRVPIWDNVDPNTNPNIYYG